MRPLLFAAFWAVPGTLERRVDKQGHRGWNVPGWDKDLYQ